MKKGIRYKFNAICKTINGIYKLEFNKNFDEILTTNEEKNVIENKPLENIYGIKFSDNEVETFESIDNSHTNIYTDYINYDATDDKKGCINQKIKDNKVFFKRNITCNYQVKSYEIEDFFEPNNNIITLVKKDDFKVATINYNKIEVDKNYFAFKLYGKEYLIKQKKKKMKKEIKKLL